VRCGILDDDDDDEVWILVSWGSCEEEEEELAVFSLCHLFRRQATRKSDILYTYSVVAFGLALPR
jgi:hypothetical protein